MERTDSVIIPEVLRSKNKTKNPEYEEIIRILKQPHAQRSKKEIDKVYSKILDWDVFGKYVCEHLDRKILVKRLIEYMKIETYQKDDFICDYDDTAYKMFVVLRGSVKDFQLKPKDQIEAETIGKRKSVNEEYQEDEDVFDLPNTNIDSPTLYKLKLAQTRYSLKTNDLGGGLLEFQKNLLKQDSTPDQVSPLKRKGGLLTPQAISENSGYNFMGFVNHLQNNGGGGGGNTKNLTTPNDDARNSKISISINDLGPIQEDEQHDSMSHRVPSANNSKQNIPFGGSIGSLKDDSDASDTHSPKRDSQAGTELKTIVGAFKFRNSRKNLKRDSSFKRMLQKQSQDTPTQQSSDINKTGDTPGTKQSLKDEIIIQEVSETKKSQPKMIIPEIQKKFFLSTPNQQNSSLNPNSKRGSRVLDSQQKRRGSKLGRQDSTGGVPEDNSNDSKTSLTGSVSRVDSQNSITSKSKKVQAGLKKLKTASTTIGGLKGFNRQGSKRPGLLGEGGKFEILKEKHVNERMMQHFKEYENKYFFGNVFKLQMLQHLYVGDCFGLLALKEDGARERAVVADEDCVCLSLHKVEFQSIFDEERDRIKNKVEVFKQKFTSWRGDEDYLIQFSHFWEEKKYTGNEIIFDEGADPNFIYLVADGEVMLTQQTVEVQPQKRKVDEGLPYRFRNSSQKPYRIQISLVARGGLIGEAELFNGTPMKFRGVIKTQSCTIFQIDEQKLNLISGRFYDLIDELKMGYVEKSSWQNDRKEKLYQQLNIDPETLSKPSTSLQRKYKNKAISGVDQNLVNAKYDPPSTKKSHYVSTKPQIVPDPKFQKFAIGKLDLHSNTSPKPGQELSSILPKQKGGDFQEQNETRPSLADQTSPSSQNKILTKPQTAQPSNKKQKTQRTKIDVVFRSSNMNPAKIYAKLIGKANRDVENLHQVVQDAYNKRSEHSPRKSRKSNTASPSPRKSNIPLVEGSLRNSEPKSPTKSPTKSQTVLIRPKLKEGSMEKELVSKYVTQKLQEGASPLAKRSKTRESSFSKAAKNEIKFRGFTQDLSPVNQKFDPKKALKDGFDSIVYNDVDVEDAQDFSEHIMIQEYKDQIQEQDQGEAAAVTKAKKQESQYPWIRQPGHTRTKSQQTTPNELQAPAKLGLLRTTTSFQKQRKKLHSSASMENFGNKSPLMNINSNVKLDMQNSPVVAISPKAYDTGSMSEMSQSLAIAFKKFKPHTSLGCRPNIIDEVRKEKVKRAQQMSSTSSNEMFNKMKSTTHSANNSATKIPTLRLENMRSGTSAGNQRVSSPVNSIGSTQNNFTKAKTATLLKELIVSPTEQNTSKLNEELGLKSKPFLNSALSTATSFDTNSLARLLSLNNPSPSARQIEFLARSFSQTPKAAQAYFHAKSLSTQSKN